ncbi:hypothetical protein B6E78_07930 [Edwardsiella ictaluri]|nr:hypothetical protein B6E78_07930 [Edwardsiella ictaluri]
MCAGVITVSISFTPLSRHFYTNISTEKVNKSGLATECVFITLHLSVSYPEIMRYRCRKSWR